MAAIKAVVVTDRLQYTGTDDIAKFADRGEVVELSKKQFDDARKLGAVRRESEVEEGEDPTPRTVAAEPEEPDAASLPTGQSDPSALNQYPPQGSVRDDLSADKLAAMTLEEAVGWATRNPSQTKSVIALEQEGRNRPGVLAALKGALQRHREARAPAEPNEEEGRDTPPDPRQPGANESEAGQSNPSEAVGPGPDEQPSGQPEEEQGSGSED